MKRTLTVAVATLAVGALAFPAAASNIISFGGTGLHEKAEFPAGHTVSATFTRTLDKGLCVNNNGTEWSFWVEDEDGGELAKQGGEFLMQAAGTPDRSCVAGTTQTKTFVNLSFPEAGTYILKGTLKTKQGTDLDEADEGSVELVQEIEEEIIVTYPAAPSVAARILNDHDIPARYGTGRSGGNHIADVAAEMTRTKGTDFQGVAKRDVVAYSAKVRAFLEGKGIGLN